MPFKFNPFSGNFDQTGSGGGGGSSYLDGEVATYSDLPLDGTAALNTAWLVREASGAWFINRKPAGIYIRTSTAGVSRDADYNYAGVFPDLFEDDNFAIVNSDDVTKVFKIDASSITSGTTRTLMIPDASGTIELAGVVRQPSTVYADAVYVTGGTLSGINGIYLRAGDDNGRGFYKSTTAGYSFWWDSGNGLWILSDYSQGNEYFTSDSDVTYPWQATVGNPWTQGANAAGTAVPTVAQATLAQVQFDAANESVGVKSPKSGNAGSNEVVLGSDTRLTDSRTPSSHASSHASSGSDPLFDQDLNSTDAVTFESVTATDLFGLSAVEVVGVSPNRINVSGELGLEFFGTTAASTRTNLGLGTAAVADIGNGAGDVSEGDHGHGNITSDGKIGSTAGLPLKTGTAGVVEAGVFGTGAGEFAEGNHTHELTALDATGATNGHVLTADGAGGVTFAAASGGGVTGAAASASDVLGVSGSDITGVDAGSDKIVFWDDSASELTYLATVGPTFDGTTLRWPVELVIACSDETTNLTTGTAKVTFRAPYAFLLTGVRASVNTAPTGSTLIVDINNGANSALSTKLSIDASEKTSTTAATAAVIDTTYDDISDDAEITIDIDQIGSTIAGKGLKVTLIGTRA